MSAISYAKTFNLTICFVKEEYDLSIFDNYKEERVCQIFLQCISDIEIIEKEKCYSLWPPNEYSEQNDKNKKFFIPNFVNEEINFEKYSIMYHQDNKIVSIPNFVSSSVLESIRNEIETFVFSKYSIVPNNNDGETKIYNIYDDNLKERFDECDFHLLCKNFTYRFKRTFSNHHFSCSCIHCRLQCTIANSSFTDAVCKIVGCKKLSQGEFFLSCYSKNDFLTMHHDIGKGDIAVTIYFTYDWDPNYGGVLHFCDEEKNIYKSITPMLGSLNVFHVKEEPHKDHFVSQVVVDKKRIALSTWYTIIE
jgi:Rps23 Pro-64 3,4-dihydroxylase Tpa1-like proline 4-hydroxylase